MKKFISIFLIFVLFVSLISFSAFAVPGDVSGVCTDFVWLTPGTNNLWTSYPVGTTDGLISSYMSRAFQYTDNSTSDFVIYLLLELPYPVISGRLIFRNQSISPFLNLGTVTNFRFRQFDSEGSLLSTSGITSASGSPTIILTSTVKFIGICVRFTYSNPSTIPFSVSFHPSYIDYYQMNYDTSSDSSYDPALDEDILDGVVALASSLNDLETGPYSAVSGVSVDSNGDLQHTLTQNASLEDLLNALGIAGTDSNHVIRGIYNNFGSYFTLYSIDDSTSSTTQIYRGLPQYVNALGQSLTDGINRLQRDNNLLYNSISSLSSSQSALNTTLQDALYEETDSSPAENWSVAKWLKGIYDSISGFFTNFWSPAETDLKSAAEPGMQAAADNGLVASSSDVDSMNDIGNAFSSFASFPNVDPMDAVNILSDSDYYRFWTQETEDDLLRHDSVQSRGLKSSGSDVEYVDVLADHLKELHSILGVNVDGK